MAEKNSLWRNIRKKAEQNRRTGAKPKKPTAEMLRQERKIKAQKADGGYMYPDGGKTKVYTDPKEFKKAERAYNDSLSAYKAGKDFFDDFSNSSNTFKRVTPNQYHIEAAKDIFNTNINPSEIYEDPNSAADIFIPLWKKPEIKPVLEKPTVDKLQSKQYSNFSSNQQPSIVGNVENISPSEINMDNFYEGQYEKYRRSPYEDPMYRVWVPGQQMQIVPEEQFKKLNDEYALKDLNQKSYGGYMYDGGGGVNPGKQKAVASTTDVSVRALPEGLFEQVKANPPARQPQTISVVDKRKQNPITKKPINPNRDLVGGKFEDTIPIEIIKSSYKHGVDPATALSVGLLESRMGTTDPNVGHIMVDPYSDYMPGAEDMVLMIKEKQDYAKKLGYTDPLLQLQAYNGLGVLSNKRGEIGKSAYGLPIPKEGIDLRQNPLYGKKVKNVRDSVIMQSPDLVRLMDYYKPKMDGGYMYYAGGPMEYKVGGTLEDVGKLLVNTVASPIEQISGNNFVNWNYNNKWAADAAAVSEGIIGAATDVAGSVLLPGVYGQAKGAIQGFTKNIGNSTEEQRNANKWANTTGQIASSAGDLTAGIMSGDVKQIVGGSGKLLGTIGGETGSKELSMLGQVAGIGSMFINPSQTTSSSIPTGLPIDSSIPSFNPTTNIVNQGLSFAANGGNINNNSLNLQNSMRGKYNSYKKRYSKGGTFQKFGINEIPDSAGYHHENAYGGVPIGPNAMVEGGEFVLDNNYVVSDEVDGMNTQTDEFGRTMAQNLKRDLSKYTMRDLNSKNRDSLRRPMDPLAEQTINQIKQKAMMETEMARAEAQAKEQERQMMVEGALQYAAAGGKLNKDISKIVEEEYAAAYGGYINPKKYKGLNMPYSKGGKLPKEVLRARVESHMSPEEADAYVNQYAEGGGIHIKESKRGTFTAAATKHGNSVQEFARQVLANKGNYSPAMVKKANFARNASKWKHAEGGNIRPDNPGFNALPEYVQAKIMNNMAHGGPVVSNVNQDFDLYAQNRGGMMMAQGGNMYANGGPPDGDPNSLDYITGVSDFMYSPEFLNYWTNTQDKRNVNYESIYDRGNLPLSEERFSPTEGISDFDRTLGNLYSAEKAIFLNTNPDGSVCYIIDGQKVCGPPGQIQAMLANRDRTYQAQAVADVYQNTTGDFAPYNYNNITGSTAARSMSQPDYSGDQNFTDRQNKIRGMVSNAMTKNQSTLVQPIKRMQSKNLQQLPTDNTILGVIGGAQQMPGLSDYASTSLGEFSDQFTPEDIQYSSYLDKNKPTPMTGPVVSEDVKLTPEEIAALQYQEKYGKSGQFTSDLINNQSNITGLTNLYKNTPTTIVQPSQSDVTPTVFPQTGISSTQPKQPKQPNQGLTGLDYVSMLAQAGAGFHQLGLGLKGGDPVNYQRITAEKIDPTVAIALAAEEGRRAQDSAAYLMRQSAPTSGSYMNNLRNLSLQSGKQTALQSAGLRYQADVENARTQTGVNAQNAQIAMQEQIDRLQEKDAARTNITEGLSGIGSSTANMIRDYRINQINQMIAKNIGTNDYKFDPVNQTITYRNQNGEIVTVPAQTVVPSNVAVNVGTGQIQQPGTSQFQTGFNNRLNESFRNRFRGINSGKNN